MGRLQRLHSPQFNTHGKIMAQSVTLSQRKKNEVKSNRRHLTSGFYRHGYIHMYTHEQTFYTFPHIKTKSENLCVQIAATKWSELRCINTVSEPFPHSALTGCDWILSVQKFTHPSAILVLNEDDCIWVGCGCFLLLSSCCVFKGLCLVIFLVLSTSVWVCVCVLLGS